MVQCKSCGGIYTPTQADGTLYFHRCPPLSYAELDAAVKAGKVVLPLGETADLAIQRRLYERNAVRDENLPSTKATDTGKMKSAGAGVRPVADPDSGVVIALP